LGVKNLPPPPPPLLTKRKRKGNEEGEKKEKNGVSGSWLLLVLATRVTIPLLQEILDTPLNFCKSSNPSTVYTIMQTLLCDYG